MMVDATIFNGELSMLEFRMKILNPFVDRFIVIEADKTFQGQDREWTHEIGRLAKVLPFRVSVDWQDIPFYVEDFQRNSLKDSCSDLGDGDILLWGDVDEIPSREFIIAAINQHCRLAVCEQALFYYRPNHLRDTIWCGTVLSTVGQMRRVGGKALRTMQCSLSGIRGGQNRHGKSWNGNHNHFGWHLSYFGGTKQIQNKLKSFSHLEFNRPEFLDGKHLDQCRRTGEGLFRCGTPVIRVERDFFPDYFVKSTPEDWWL